MPWPLSSVSSSSASWSGRDMSENAFQERISQCAGTSQARTAQRAWPARSHRLLDHARFFRIGCREPACLDTRDTVSLSVARRASSCHQQNVNAHK